MKCNILITGGAGFIGSCLAERLAKDPNNNIVIVDNLVTGNISKIPVSEHGNLRFIKADVNSFKDISGIFYSGNFDYVFHYAALVGVSRTLAHPVMVLNDILGIKNVLNLSKNAGVKRVFYSSSSEVYGEPVEMPQNEHTTPLNSRLPYAIVKNVGEAYLRSFKKEYGLSFTIFRFFNTYGPRQSKDFVMSRFMEAALTGRDLEVYGDGSQSRTFCHVHDNVDACVAAFQNNLFVDDIVNIGNDRETTIVELAKMILEITGSNSRIVHLPPLKEGDMTRRKPDITKMKQLLGRDLVKLEKGIGDLMRDTHYFV